MIYRRLFLRVGKTSVSFVTIPRDIHNENPLSPLGSGFSVKTPGRTSGTRTDNTTTEINSASE